MRGMWSKLKKVTRKLMRFSLAGILLAVTRFTTGAVAYNM